MLGSVNQFVQLVRILSKSKNDLNAQTKAFNKLFEVWLEFLNKGLEIKAVFSEVKNLTENCFLWENEALNFKGNSFTIKDILETMGYEAKIMFRNDYFSTQVFLVFANSKEALQEGLKQIIDLNTQELRKGA